MNDQWKSAKDMFNMPNLQLVALGGVAGKLILRDNKS